VDQATVDVFGGSIRPAPEKKNGKDGTISFAKAVALENKRGSITEAQKAGRGKKAPVVKLASAKKGTKWKRTPEDEVIDAPTREPAPSREPAATEELVQGAKR
jgi:hypothetical protein